MVESYHPLRIFTGSAHPALAQEVASILNVPLGEATTRHLPDSEIHVQIDEVVRDQDIFFIQPCPEPVNDHLMELILFMDAFRRASAHRLSVVIPYFPYARQERMAQGREAISARVVANMLEMQGAKRVIYIDIHNKAIQGFFNIPVDPLSAVPLLADYIRKLPDAANAAIVSPDTGRAGMAGKYAEQLNLPLVLMHKRRTSATSTETTAVVGDIQGRIPIIIDDVMAGGSVLKQIDALYDAGGNVVRAGGTARSNFVGYEVDATATWQANPNLGVLLGLSWFGAGAMIEDSGPSEDTLFGYLQATLTF